jgi:predicted SAM-dependent methyltransferase
MLSFARHILSQLGLKQTAWQARQQWRIASRVCRGTDRRLAAEYLATCDTPKLHIGCGKHPLGGWLNTDFEPPPGAMLLDATRAFPLADNAFSYIYSEHMIEHVPYLAGQTMLRECFRVLKPGGVLRISTPDLAFLVNLYQAPALPLHQRYIEHAISKYAPHAPRPLASFVVNNFVRNWEHQFIYDEATLRQAMEDAGFSEIVRCELQQSGHADLAGRENEARMPEGFLALESLILEGTKRL